MQRSRRGGWWVLATFAFLAVCRCGEMPAAAQPAVTSEQARQMLVEYRRAQRNPKQAAEVIRRLAALGPAGVEAAQAVFADEIARLEKTAETPPPTAALDARIEELRAKLAELREDPQLSKEKLEQVGLPVLDELTVLWQRREGLLARYYGGFTRAKAQLELSAAVLKELLAPEAPAPPPIPAAELLRQVEALLAKMSPPVSQRAQEVYAENMQIAPKIDPKLVAGMEALNRMRIMCGLEPLVFDVKLCEAATMHSADMEQHGFFAHESPVPGRTSFQDRAKLAGTTASGENIYMGGTSPVDAIKAWFLSPGHHKNMLGAGHRRQGLGRVNRHWTQLFGR